MNEDALCAMLAAVALLAVLIVAVRATRGWSSPAVVALAVWGLALGAPPIFAPAYKVWVPGIWLAALMVLTFAAGSLVGEFGQRPSPSRPLDVDPRKLRLAVVIATVVGALSIPVMLTETDQPLSELLTIPGWVQMAARFSIARYTEDYVEPLAARLLFVGFYSGSLLGGALASSSADRNDRLLSVAPVLVAFVYGAMTTARASFLLAGVMWLAAFLASMAFRAAVRVSRAAVVTMAAVAPAFLVIFLAVQVARTGAEDLTTLSDNIEHSRTSFFSQNAALSLWLKDHLHNDVNPRLGGRTFGGVFSLLGLGERKIGIYDTVDIGMNQDSNIFTALRSLIEDASLPGAFLVALLGGFFAGQIHRAVREGKQAWVPALAAVYCYAFWSPITSFFNYNTLIAALLVFAVALKVLQPSGVRSASAAATLS